MAAIGQACRPCFQRCGAQFDLASSRQLRASTSGSECAALLPGRGFQRLQHAPRSTRRGCRSVRVSAGLHPANRSFGQYVSDKQYEMQARLDKSLERAKQNEGVRQVGAALVALHEALQPMYDAWAVLQKWFDGQYWNFIAFTEDETRRKWRWQRRSEELKQYWIDIKGHMTALVLTLCYQVLVPPSLLWAIIVPLHLSWIMYNSVVASPIVLGVALIAPFKFVPWAGWTLI